MSRTALADLRAEVVKRAHGRCEYCQLPENTGWAVHEVDHVIARKHGGRTELDNLAYACPACNRYKGTDLASIDPHTGKVTRLFNPRTQTWGKHFRLNVDGTITSHRDSP